MARSRGRRRFWCYRMHFGWLHYFTLNTETERQRTCYSGNFLDSDRQGAWGLVSAILCLTRASSFLFAAASFDRQTEPIIFDTIGGLHRPQREVKQHFSERAHIVSWLFQLLIAVPALICVTTTGFVRTCKTDRAKLLLGYWTFWAAILGRLWGFCMGIIHLWTRGTHGMRNELS